ncbi:MAG: hypothetical protein WC465_01990 [Patescibacteria group bacterium]
MFFCVKWLFFCGALIEAIKAVISEPGEVGNHWFFSIFCVLCAIFVRLHERPR